MSHLVIDLITKSAIDIFEVGVANERARIIRLAKKQICFDHKDNCDHGGCHALSELIKRMMEEE